MVPGRDPVGRWARAGVCLPRLPFRFGRRKCLNKRTSITTTRRTHGDERLNEGFQSAFLALVVLAGIGLALALLLLGRPRKAPQERLEAVPVPIQND